MPKALTICNTTDTNLLKGYKAGPL